MPRDDIGCLMGMMRVVAGLQNPTPHVCAAACRAWVLLAWVLLARVPRQGPALPAETMRARRACGHVTAQPIHLGDDT